MCKKVYICTDHSKWDTCRVEKMGCPGCAYCKYLYEIDENQIINSNVWRKDVKMKEVKNNEFI